MRAMRGMVVGLVLMGGLAVDGVAQTRRRKPK